MIQVIEPVLLLVALGVSVFIFLIIIFAGLVAIILVFNKAKRDDPRLASLDPKGLVSIGFLGYLVTAALTYLAVMQATHLEQRRDWWLEWCRVMGAMLISYGVAGVVFIVWRLVAAKVRRQRGQ